MKKLKHMLITGEKGLGMSYSNIEIGYRYYFKRKYDIRIDGYQVRGIADFNRIDLSKLQRRKYHRKIKLNKRNRIRLEEAEI